MGMPGPQGNGYSVWTSRYGVVNVKDFGAIGDGVHDDTTEIQAALNAIANGPSGAVLYLPAGVYRITSPLTYSSANALAIQGVRNPLYPIL